MREKVIRLYLVIMIVLGFASLNYVFFQEPRVSSLFQIYQNANNPSIRKAAVLFIVGFAAFLLLVFITFLSLTFFNKIWFEGLLNKLIPILQSKKWFFAILLLLFLGALISGQYAITAFSVENQLDQIFLLTVRPVLFWVCFCCFFTISILLLYSSLYKGIKPKRFIRPLFIFLVILILGIFLLRSGYGYKVTNELTGNFDLTGYPIVGYQVFWAWIFTIVAYLIVRYLLNGFGNRFEINPVLIDIVIGVFLFMTAFLLWKGLPLKPHMFYDHPRPPNYELYPNSDALLYDRTAQSLLAQGEFQTFLQDYQDYIALRPMLALFYVMLHLITGLGNEGMIPIMLFVFSFMPVLIYWLGKEVHSRGAGVLAALILLIREGNGQILGDVVTGVHAKLLMSEIPAMMGVILFLILFIKWLKNPDQGKFFAYLSGGVLGITMLIRAEMGILIIFVSLGALFVLRGNLASYVRGMVAISLSIIVVISPWIWRNWKKSGQIYLDRPGNRIDLIGDTIKKKPNVPKEEEHYYFRDNFRYEKTILQKQPGNDSVEYIEYSKSAGIKLQSLPMVDLVDQGDNYGSSLDLILNHITNQMVQSVVYLPSVPLRLDIDFISKMIIGKVGKYYGGFFYSPESYVKSLPYWWKNWDGTIANASKIPILVNLALISIGISGVWRREKWVVGVPILALLGHFMIYALTRRSGGRFIQEVDWITAFFFSIGLIELSVSSLNWVLNKKEIQFQTGTDVFSPPSFLRSYMFRGLILVTLLAVGSIPPLTEQFVPNAYSKPELEEKISFLLQNGASPLSTEEKNPIAALQSNGGTVIWGRGLYPRYFQEGEDLKDVRSFVLGFLDRSPFMRSELFIIGTQTDWGVLFREKVPDQIPHGSDVIAVGCEKAGVLDIVALVVYDSQGEIIETLFRDGQLSEFNSCPLPDPR